MSQVSYSNESPGSVHLDMITHMLNQRGGAHKAIDRQSLYQEAIHQVGDSAMHMCELRRKTDQELEAFIQSPKLTSIGFPPMDKVYRYIIHEAANDKGLISYSIGAEEKDRHTIVWKVGSAPSQEELQSMQATKEMRPDAQSSGEPVQ